uniref:NR LBD domain-containing protein n=1 Tax=Arion vulgaris TaxID=1028688 RepID=A0A0B6Y7V6_9EUPU
MFLIYNFIDVENRIFRGLDNQWKCTDEIYKMISDPESEETTETLDVYFRFCQSIQKLKLSDEELVVIRALIVMSPGRLL